MEYPRLLWTISSSASAPSQSRVNLFSAYKGLRAAGVQPGQGGCISWTCRASGLSCGMPGREPGKAHCSRPALPSWGKQGVWKAACDRSCPDERLACPVRELGNVLRCSQIRQHLTNINEPRAVGPSREDDCQWYNVRETWEYFCFV